MKDFNSNELNELLNTCAEQGITLKEYVVGVCGLRRPDFDSEIKRCIADEETDLLKKYIAVGMITRFKKAVYTWAESSIYLEMRKDTQLALINYFIKKGEYKLANKMTTEKVYPLLNKLDDKSIKYLFTDYGDNIQLFTGYDSCIMALSDDDKKKITDMHIDGLKRLKALYKKLKSEGFNFSLRDKEYNEDGRIADESAYIELTRKDGSVNKIIPAFIYFRHELMWVFGDEKRNEIRTLQCEIENIINYYC